MQRVTLREYGGPDRLTVETVDDPQNPVPTICWSTSKQPVSATSMT